MPKIPTEVIVILIALFGAIVHATIQWKNARDESKVYTLLDFAIFSIIGLFAGWLSGTIAGVYVEEQGLINAITGLGAVLGVTGINVVSNIAIDILKEVVRSRLGK